MPTGVLRPQNSGSGELVIGLSLLVPTLVIGFWPRVAIDFYQASTNALSIELSHTSQLALSHLPMLG